MKRIEGFLKSSCAYTVVILAFFYAFAAANNFGGNGISFSRFALIFLFGAVIAAAEYIFLLKINRVISVILHYGVLLFAFSMIFLASGVIGNAGSKVFTVLVIFTLFYAFLFTAVYLVKRWLSKLDMELDEKRPAKAKVVKKQKSEYQPKFKG